MRPATKHLRIVVVTGLSGSGKSTAIKTLEDIGYFCVDNMPAPLLHKLLALCEQSGEVDRVALGIDMRTERLASDVRSALQALRASGHRVEVLFVDCDDEVLIRRYSETRRRHPLSGDGGIRHGIDAERALLEGLREDADLVVDTSSLTVHDLRDRINEVFGAGDRRMSVVVMSFGFKHGTPREADMVFDVRFLPNPYFVDTLRPLTGLDEPVRAFLRREPWTADFLRHVFNLLDFVLPCHDNEGKVLLTIAVGCTGGVHRSVYIAGELHEHVAELGYDVRVLHRDAAGT